MSHFYGAIQGSGQETTRGGNKASGYDAVAASWEGSVRVRLYHDKDTGEDLARVTLEPWRGAGVRRELYHGPVGRYEPQD